MRGPQLDLRKGDAGLTVGLRMQRGQIKKTYGYVLR